MPYDVERENIIFTEKVIDVQEGDLSRYDGAKVLETQIEYQHVDKIIDKPVYVDNIIE